MSVGGRRGIEPDCEYAKRRSERWDDVTRRLRPREVIVGSRRFPRPWDVSEYVMELPDDAIVISGAAPGVDSWALHTADMVCRCDEPCRHWPPLENLQTIAIPADWNAHGRAAGPIRNEKLVRVGHRVKAFWDGVSRGTANTIRLAREAGKLLPVTTRRAAAPPSEKA
jgi:hypothetical protein